MSTLTANEAKQAREERNLSQSKVARDTGLSRSYICQFESGKRNLEAQSLAILAGYYQSISPPPTPNKILDECAPIIKDVHDYFETIDGIAINEEVGFDYVVGDLMSEYEENKEIIMTEWNSTVDHGFWGLDEDDIRNRCLPLLVRMARQYQLTQIFLEATNPEPIPSKVKEIQTRGDCVEWLFGKLLPDRIKPID